MGSTAMPGNEASFGGRPREVLQDQAGSESFSNPIPAWGLGFGVRGFFKLYWVQVGSSDQILSEFPFSLLRYTICIYLRLRVKGLGFRVKGLGFGVKFRTRK